MCAALLVASSARADRMSVRVRWEPGSSESVAGYKIYMRYAGEPYGDPIDVGLPSTESGTMAAVVKGVDGTVDYAFAVTSYGQDGTESTLSNEGMLRAAGVMRPICAELACGSDGCAPVASPDGLGCFDGDPCAVGVCASGACAVASDAPAPLDLGVAAFQVGKAGHKRKKLVARAVLPLGDAVADSFEDATIELRDANSGGLLYFASVAGSDFGFKQRRNTFVYPKKRRHRAPAGANGLKRVSVRVGTGGSELSVKAASSDLARLSGDDALMWVVRVGDRCVRTLDLACGPMKRGRMRCN